MPKIKKTWVVTASGDRALDEVAKDLRKSGFHVEEVFHEIGSIHGHGGEDAVKKARKVKGVADVSANVPIDIGPPGSKDTW